MRNISDLSQCDSFASAEEHASDSHVYECMERLCIDIPSLAFVCTQLFFMFCLFNKSDHVSLQFVDITLIKWSFPVLGTLTFL